MARIVIRPGTPQAQEFELKPGKNYVGRGFANDLKLDDASVSSSHASIEVNGNLVTITDLGSTNGTRINGLPATGSPLQSGHMLKLGAVELLFLADAVAGSAPAPVSPPPPTAAAAQIATEFIIRDPSRVGVAPPAPPPPPAPVPSVGEIRIPAATLSALPQPAPGAVAPTPIRPSSELRIPGVTPPAPVMAPPLVPAPVLAAPAAASASANRLTFANVVPAPVSASAPVMTAPAAAAPQPVAAPAVSVEAIDAPPGKTVCKFHKTTPGQWLCEKCHELFCSLCVSTRPTPAGAGYFCRTCGTQCVQVKLKMIARKEKKLTAYSDGTILLRTIGFGLGGSVVGGGLWTGFAALTGTDMPAIFAPLVGVSCGYAVKIASQDRPGGFFSAMAILATLIGVAIGMGAAVLIIPHYTFTINSLAIGVFGLVLGLFVAWKLGGGDF